MRELLTNPGNWVVEQWLAFSILVFILLAILVMIHRLLSLFNATRKPPRQPNLRRLRRLRSGRYANPHDRQRGND